MLNDDQKSSKIIELPPETEALLEEILKQYEDPTSPLSQERAKQEAIWQEQAATIRKQQAEDRRKEIDYIGVIKKYADPAAIGQEQLQKIQEIDLRIKKHILDDLNYFNKNELNDKYAATLLHYRTAHSRTLNTCYPIYIFSYAYSNFFWNVNDNILDNKVVRTQAILDDPNAKFIFTKEDLKDFRVGYGKAFRTTHVEASEETDYYNNRTAVVNGRFLCPDSIPTMMDWYCNWMTDRFDDCKKAKMSPITFAAMAGFIFVSIHPYSDGNGRTRDFIEDFILQSFRYPIKQVTYRLRDDAFFRKSADLDGNNFLSVEYDPSLLSRSINLFCDYMLSVTALFEENYRAEVSFNNQV